MIVKILCADFCVARVFALIDADGDYLMGTPKAESCVEIGSTHATTVLGSVDTADVGAEGAMHRKTTCEDPGFHSGYDSSAVVVGLSRPNRAHRASRKLSEINLADLELEVEMEMPHAEAPMKPKDTAPKRRGFSPFRWTRSRK
jgi:hypothetical protein